MNEEKEELLEPALPTGALLDDRVQELKDLDYLHEELFSGETSIVWKEKKNYTRYSPRNQGTSLSCVANGLCVALEANEKNETGETKIFSHKDGYIRRVNRPYGGMFMDDALRIAREGLGYESQVPSMKLGEKEINKEYPITGEIIEARGVHSALSSVVFKKPTVDKIAEVLDKGTPVILFWFFNDSLAYKEWWRTNPQVVDEELKVDDEPAARHQACAVDFTVIDGVKHLLIQDSAGVGTGLGEYKDLRLVSEDFFNKRCYAASYLLDKKNLDYVNLKKPKYTFTRVLKVGSTGEDVEALQKILVYEGCMAIKSPTRLFAGLTRAGVVKLQENHAKDILEPLGLKKGTGTVGVRTLQYLNKNYA